MTPPILAALLAALIFGVALLLLGLRGRRMDRSPVCRDCGFDLAGILPDGKTCPECGSGLNRAKAVRIGRRERPLPPPSRPLPRHSRLARSRFACQDPARPPRRRANQIPPDRRRCSGALLGRRQSPRRRRLPLRGRRGRGRGDEMGPTLRGPPPPSRRLDHPPTPPSRAIRERRVIVAPRQPAPAASAKRP